MYTIHQLHRIVMARVYRLSYRNPDTFLTDYICWRLRDWLSLFLQPLKECVNALESPHVSFREDSLRISWLNSEWRLMRLVVHPDSTVCQIDVYANRTVARRYECHDICTEKAPGLWRLFDLGEVPKDLKLKLTTSFGDGVA